MQKINFYTKLNCHLCDQAYLLLMEVALEHTLEIDVVDITHAHNQLEAKYGERIPVIAIPEADTELSWPFTGDDIRAYLNWQL